MQEIPSGTLSENRDNNLYVGHWRIAENMLMIKLGVDVENVLVDARLKNPEALARQVFTRMVDRLVARK